MKKKGDPGCLFRVYFGDDILPKYEDIIINKPWNKRIPT